MEIFSVTNLYIYKVKSQFGPLIVYNSRCAIVECMMLRYNEAVISEVTPPQVWYLKVTRFDFHRHI